jgi:hypothetical protein
MRNPFVVELISSIAPAAAGRPVLLIATLCEKSVEDETPKKNKQIVK